MTGEEAAGRDSRSSSTQGDDMDPSRYEARLEPLAPTEGVEMYVNERRSDVSEKTLQNHKYRLDTFVEFCKEHDIENLNRLTGRDIHRYRNWRQAEVSKVTLKSHLATLRVFLEFAAKIDAVVPGLREKVTLPKLADEEASRDEKLDEKRATEILDYLKQFQYASREHVILAVLWHTGVRLGTLRALDIDDFDAEAEALRIRHRPETDTPLKNGQAAERSIAVGPHFCQVLRDYTTHNRHKVADEYGRDPLLTSTQGRLSSTAIRNTVYRETRPCEIGECPHDRDPRTCEAMNPDHASECPSSRSPHGIRRGAITVHLREGTPEEVVSDRMNVSPEVLDRHYDRRTEDEKREVRREFLRELWSQENE